MLETLITSKTRIKLLLKFFSNQSNRAYLRSLADEYGESTNAVRVELNRLSEAGLLETEPAGNTILYKANTKHPIFNDIKSLVSKYLGFDQIIENVLSRIGNLELAVVVGDYAQGLDSGIIDLRLVGHLDMPYLEQLVLKAEALIKRKIRYSIQLPDKAGLGYDFEGEAHIVLWSA
ncbi:MAG: winged helix-turn-helix domain-containing protein [Bacteroidia bacterium]